MAVLTPREREIVSLLAGGIRPTEIAARLCLSRVTVYNHIRNARNKTQSTSTIHLAIKASQQK